MAGWGLTSSGIGGSSGLSSGSGSVGRSSGTGSSSGISGSLVGPSGGSSSGTKNTSQVIEALKGMGIGGKGSPAAAMPQYPTTAQPLVNKSTPNATMEGIISTLSERAKGGMGVPEALRLSEAAQRRDTSGRLKEQAQLAARQGQLGSGSQELGASNIQAEGQRNAANSADQLAYKGEMDRNALWTNISGQAAQSEGLQGNQQERGLAQWMAQQQAANQQYSAQANTALQQQQIDQAAQMNIFSILKQLF